MNNNILTYAEVFNGNYKSPTDRLIELANTKENKAKGYGYPILYRKAIDLNPKNDVFFKKSDRPKVFWEARIFRAKCLDRQEIQQTHRFHADPQPCR